MSSKGITRRALLQGAGMGALVAASGALPLRPVWAKSEGDVIKLASVNSLSGGFARYGEEIQRGVDIAISVINEKGVKVGGKSYMIKQQIYDDKTDANTSARLVEKAVTSDGAQMVLAGLGSVIVKASIPVAQRLQFPMMTHWAQVDGVFAGQKGNPYMYGAMPPFSRYYTRISKMVSGFKNPDVRTAAMITPNDELGVYMGHNYFPSDLKKAGIKDLGTEFFPPKSQQYGAAVDRIRRKNPDMLVINCYTQDIIGVFKEMQSINYFPRVLVVEAPTKLAESLGDAINGVFVPSFWDPSISTTKDEFIGTSKNFAALYKAKYKQEPPDFVAACGANNVVIYAQAMMAAGSISDTKKINHAFRTMDGETFFSPVKFSDDGLNREGVVYPSQFQNSRPVIVYPQEVRQAEPIHPYPGYKKT